MKRAGNLFCQITEIENLELAFWKAQRGKSGKKEVRLFRENLHDNLFALRNDLLSGDPAIGNYHYFTIYDPKERVICAADFRERVMQHAVINICEPYFEKYQIYDSYACRKGKGVDACLERCKYFCRRYKWYLKLDIHKYFDTIDHKILLNLLNRRFKDPYLLDFFARVIDSYEIMPGKGVPIGNLLSQYFANLYLGTLDHEIKDVLRIGGFLRYMDDFIIFSDNKDQLKNLLKNLEVFLKEKLKLKLNLPQINRTYHSVPFLNYRVSCNGLRLSLKAKQRFRRKIAFANQIESPELALPLLAFINRAESFNFRNKLFYGPLSDGSNRVNRGGSWNNNAVNCRSANRNNWNPDNRNNNLGFRVALVPAQG